MPSVEILPWCAPTNAFLNLAGKPWAHLFHGGEKSLSARWSFIVARPSGTVTVRNGQVRRDSLPVNTGLIEALRQLQSDFDTDEKTHLADHEKPPFRFGLAGFVGYEAARCFEPGLRLPRSPFALPDIAMGYYEAVAAFDRTREQIVVTGNSPRAVAQLIDQLTIACSLPDHAPLQSADVKSHCNFTRSQFMSAIEDARAAILSGDIFQANIARQIVLDLHNVAQTDDRTAAFDIFRQMAKQTDANHAAMLQFPEGAIISNSPERFFKISPVSQGQFNIIVEPIKGTIKRGDTPKEDAAFAQELSNSEKDRAENIMIADLLRNDLSRVCTAGSVQEDDICSILSLTYVHHLVSRISGTLRPRLDALDALAALFPCGSITGAPKIEAMKVIGALEKIGRGPYCGAIGYINADGAADFSVAIRSMILEKGASEHALRCTIPVGGGITLMSQAQSEYEETVLKAIGLTAGLAARFGAFDHGDKPS